MENYRQALEKRIKENQQKAIKYIEEKLDNMTEKEIKLKLLDGAIAYDGDKFDYTIYGVYGGDGSELKILEFIRQLAYWKNGGGIDFDFDKLYDMGAFCGGIYATKNFSRSALGHAILFSEAYSDIANEIIEKHSDDEIVQILLEQREKVLEQSQIKK